MTSQISFYKLMRQDLKTRGWLAALLSVASLLAFPLRGMMGLENKIAMVQDRNSGFTLKELTAWYHGMTGPGDQIGFIFVIAAAVILAITGFSYLHSRERLDFYHSFPVRREALFGSIFAGGIVMFAVPYLISYGLLLLCGAVNQVDLKGAGAWCLQTVGWNLLFFLLIYAVTALAMLLTGKLVVGIMGSVVLLGYGGLVVYAFEALHNFFFYSYVDSGREKWIFSPVISYQKTCSMIVKDGHMPVWAMGCVLLAVAVVIGLCFFCCRLRPTEAAENAVAFPRLEGIIKVAVTVPASIAAGYLAASQNVRGEKWFLITGLISVVLLNLVIEFIYHMDLRKIFRQKLALAVSLLLAGGVFLFFKFDLSGFDSYFPKKGEISQIAVRAEGCINYISGHENGRLTDRLDALEIPLTSEIYHALEETVENQPEKEEYLPELMVMYHLDNGKRVYRKYAAAIEDQVKLVKMFLQDPLYKKQAFQVEDLAGENLDTISVSDIKNRYYNLSLSAEQKQELLRTYAAELMGKDIFSLWGVEPLAAINVDRYIDEDDASRSYWTSSLPVYKEFKKTVGLIEKYGYHIRSEVPLDEIADVYIEDSRQKDGDDSQTETRLREPDQYRVEDQDVIRTLTEDLIPLEVAGIWYDGELTENGIHVNIIWKDGSQSVFYLRRGAEIPERKENL